ncbi:IclR family transcriptional regulator [Phenylobacterium sp. LjRoot219]|uniref:IclR family transcriptional regulator n=1 Tax=Phenylobacterium sp. LjRoot219 TaxID=3342283 RepID=UPI003ED12CB0
MASDQGRGSEIPRHQTVRSVVKATHLLLSIADSDGLTAAQAAAAVDLPLPTAYHLLNTLLAEGMLSRDSARRYRLGPKIAALSLAYAKIGPSEQMLSALRRLAESTGETAYLSSWRDGEVVALATIEGSSAVRVGRIHTELRGAEHARASGKLMLAFLTPPDLDAYLSSHKLTSLTSATITDERELRSQLATIREQGYSVEEGEFTDGVGCVSAPIIENGSCVACFTISAPLQRFQEHRDVLAKAAMSASPGKYSV